MFSKRKNTSRLNSWAAAIGITGWDNSFLNINLDSNTLLLAGIILVGITIYILLHNRIKGKHEKYLTSKVCGKK